MPRKKICSKTGCNILVDDGVKYCDRHKEVDKDRQRDYDKHYRDQNSKTFYESKEWRTVREVVLVRDNGLCQDCLQDNKITVADVVDHVIPIKVAWSKRVELSNLRCLCHACHNKKTAEDKRKYYT